MSVFCVSAKLGSLQVISRRHTCTLPGAGLAWGAVTTVTSVLRVQHAGHEHPEVGGLSLFY